MQILRTIIWVLLLVALLLFSIANWDPTVTVRIWQGLVVDTKIPAIVIVSFLIGFVPMWLYHRADKWRLKRKIASLENAARTAQATPIATAEPEEPEVVEPTPAPVASAEETADKDDDLFSTDPAEDSDETEPKSDSPPTYRSPGS